MIERAIENWLVNTNERNYQTPFCQMLMQKGHKVYYSSKHRPFEQGKDVISEDSEGNYYAYQLKTGDVNLNKWRQIKGEIDELIQLPIQHPNIDTNKPYLSFLVLNGEITDEVRLLITQMNEDNITKDRKYSELKIINKSQLLKDFIDVQNKFLPTEITEFNDFLKIFLSDGNDIFPIKEFYELLNNSLLKEEYSKSDTNNVIASSVILTSYLLKNYQESNNYFGLINAWSVLLFTIMAYMHKKSIVNEDIIKLVENEIVGNYRDLRTEVLEKDDYLEGDWLGDGALIYRVRTTIVLGLLATLENQLILKEEGYQVDPKVIEKIKNDSNLLVFWGEEAFPYIFQIIKLMEKCNEKDISERILVLIYSSLIKNNLVDFNARPIPNPYYTFTEILEEQYGITDGEIDFEQFRYGSYTFKAIVEMIVRRGQKEVIERDWKLISRMHLNEFIPKNSIDYFYYRTDQGQNHSGVFPMTQSWAKLVENSKSMQDVEDVLIRNKDKMAYLIQIYPQRVNTKTIKMLDTI